MKVKQGSVVVMTFCSAFALGGLVGKCYHTSNTARVANLTGLEETDALEFCVAQHNGSPIIFMADALLSAEGFSFIVKKRKDKGLLPPIKLRCNKGVEADFVLKMVEEAMENCFTNITLCLHEEMELGIVLRPKPNAPLYGVP